jgi:3'-phosphoadenosine 5'-phosphosulfate sulfotransferase (PAPS reductase)/FAD synthetase
MPYDPYISETAPDGTDFPGNWAADRYFASGTNHPGEIKGILLSGLNVGVTVSEIHRPSLDELMLYAGGPSKVFVDSGAFAEVGFGPTGIYTKKLITHEDWLRRLSVYQEIAQAYRRKAYLVAPDKIADQAETLARLQRYDSQVATAAAYGANIIIPVQKGQLSMADFWARAKELVVAPEEQKIAGIPSKKDATSLEDLLAFIREARPARIHLLGIGPKSPRFTGMIEAILAVDPELSMTFDSVRITAMVGRKGMAKPRVLTAAQDEMRAAGFTGAYTVKSGALMRVMHEEHRKEKAAARAAGWKDEGDPDADIDLDLIEDNPPVAPGLFVKVAVQVPAKKGEKKPKWTGYAVFPREMKAEAIRRMEAVYTVNDVEDLVREFGDKATYESLQEFRAGNPELKIRKPTPIEVREDSSELLPYDQYDGIIVSFSGGKDSLACVLHLLEQGVPAERIELWHQCVDGRPERDRRFFDWPCTEAYCEAVAHALGCRFLLQWREGGFWGELTKGDPAPRPTAPVGFELEPGGLAAGRIGRSGGTGEAKSRMMFPAVSADLMTRWCSAVLKIDVAAGAITNDPRFKEGGNVLLVTGERRQESANRSGYATVDRHKSSTQKRRVDQYRAVLEWREQEVWDIIKRWRVRPHPAYYLGWGRVSCFPCIFGSPNQWASVRALDQKQFDYILSLERKFGHTIQIEGDIEERASHGKSFVPKDPQNIRLAMSEEYPADLAIVPETEEWRLPLGALGQVAGATGGPL